MMLLKIVKFTVEYLKEQFNETIAEAVDILTHKRTKYSVYILGISKNKLASAVKIQDLKRNLNSNRIKSLHGFNKSKVYKEALEFLINQYR